MKTLLIVACAFVAIAGADPVPVDAAAPACSFDPQDACNKCPYDRNWVQYVADGCNPNYYYSCNKDLHGVITYHKQQCDACHWFSNQDWSCSIQIKDEPCPTNAPPIIVPIPVVPDKPDFWCVDYDKDWRETVYYDTDKWCAVWDVGIFRIGDMCARGKGLISFGFPCNVEVPYFQNNQFREFTLCSMFYWFNWYGSIEMGLAYNGYAWECAPGSIRVHKTAGTDQIQASVTVQSILNVATTTTILHPNSVAPWTWHKFCLKFDGSGRSLELSVNDVSVKKTGPGLAGLTVPKKCNMRFGEVLEPFSGGYYIYSLRGAMDSISFVPKLVDDSHFQTCNFP